MDIANLKAARDKFVRNGIAVHVPAVKDFLAEIEKFIAANEAKS